MVISTRWKAKENCLDLAAYNPEKFDINPVNGLFFIVNGYSEKVLYQSIKYGHCSSFTLGNTKFSQAYEDHNEKGPVYLFFSIEDRLKFCGMAQMVKPSNILCSAFDMKWIFVKDIPNNQLCHIITLQTSNLIFVHEIPESTGLELLSFMYHYKHTTSILDDLMLYEDEEICHTQDQALISDPLSQILDAQQQHAQVTGSAEVILFQLCQEPLTTAILNSSSPQEQKQLLGERLFPLIAIMYPDHAGKITGMLLELDNSVLLHMLENKETLEAKAEEAISVLQAHQAKENALR